jgi:lipopolysaccharide transport system ATP-binding protein
MTDHVIYLKGGREIAAGEPVDVVTRYESDMADQAVISVPSNLSPKAGAQEPTGLRVVAVRFEGDKGIPLSELRSGAAARLIIEYVAERHIEQLVVTLLVREMAEEMRLVLNLNSERDGAVFKVQPGQGRVELNFPHTVLGPGLYVAKVLLGTPSFYVFDAIESYRFLVRADASMSQCAVYQPRSWHAASEGQVVRALGTREAQ